MRKLMEPFHSLLRRRRSRRNLMFWLTLGLLGGCFLGRTVLERPLAGSPLPFLIYWFLAAVIAFNLILLAAYDMQRVIHEESQRPDDLP